jgi:hypothetical protein
MTELYGLRSGRVQRIEGLDGASDIAARPLRDSMLFDYTAESFAVNLRADTGAIVTKEDNGDEVVVTSWLDSTDKSDPAGKVQTQGEVLQPSYDNHDNLWILDRAESATPRLRVRDRDGKPVEVVTSFHGDFPQVLRMAPDGVRALLVMKSKTTGKNYVQTGTIQTAAGGRLVLAQLRQLMLSLDDITDAAWNKQGLLVSGVSGTSTSVIKAPWLVNTDGSRLQLLPGAASEFAAERLASNLNKDTLPAVQDVQGHLHWQTRDLTWSGMGEEPGAPPILPIYPG